MMVEMMFKGAVVLLLLPGHVAHDGTWRPEPDTKFCSRGNPSDSCSSVTESKYELVYGSVGGSVILPCSYGTSSVDVFWREAKNSNVVLDIKNHKEDTTHQDEKYKGRVSSFPQEYNNGNFSIIMKNLQQNDNGTYEYHIPSERYLQSVDLIVSAPPSGAAGPNVLHVALICLTLLLCF